MLDIYKGGFFYKENKINVNIFYIKFGGLVYKKTYLEKYTTNKNELLNAAFIIMGTYMDHQKGHMCHKKCVLGIKTTKMQ